METAVTVALITLLGVLVAVLATHRLTLWRDRDTRRAMEARVFRKEFCSEIEQILRNNWSLQSDHIIKNALINQQQAVDVYSSFCKRPSHFKRAWNNYKAFCEAINYTNYAASSLYLETFKKEGQKPPVDPRPEFIKLVNRVLSFAQET